MQSTASLLKPSLGSLFAVRTYQKSTAALCIPAAIGGACADFNMIIYIVSEGPAGLPAQVSLNNLTARAQAATGDPALRMLNIMNVYVDQGIDPEDTTARLVVRKNSPSSPLARPPLLLLPSCFTYARRFLLSSSPSTQALLHTHLLFPLLSPDPIPSVLSSSASPLPPFPSSIVFSLYLNSCRTQSRFSILGFSSLIQRC